MFQQLAYQRLVLRFCVACNADLIEKEEESDVEEEKLLESTESREELEMS